MKAIMREEQEMKDSGIGWIGKIPYCWLTARLKDVSEIQTGSTPDKKFQAEYYSQDGGIPWIKAENLGTPYPILETKEYLTSNGCSVGRVFPANTVYVCCIASIGKVGYSTIQCSCNQQINGILFDNKYINYKYGYYLSISQEEEYVLRASGNVLKILNTQQQSYISCVIPTLNEQQLIANYLDDRCSKIDAIIAEAKASIEEYQELKQAVIYEAVTKGLDKTVEMKDSGVEWVEKIPNNWHIVKITRILDKEHPYAIGDGDHGSIKTEQYRNSGIPFIRVQNLGWGTALNMDNVVYISEEDNKQIQNSTLRPNDILFAKTGATIGKTAIMPEEIPIANTTSHVGKISISKEHNSRYIFYVLSSQIGYRQFWDIAMQKTTRPELSIEETKSIKVVLPADKTIEDSIVNYLDEKIPVFDDMINTKASLIEDLEAYKKSLIYEVVTGKRKVVA